MNGDVASAYFQNDARSYDYMASNYQHSPSIHLNTTNFVTHGYTYGHDEIPSFMDNSSPLANEQPSFEFYANLPSLNYDTMNSKSNSYRGDTSAPNGYLTLGSNHGSRLGSTNLIASHHGSRLGSTNLIASQPNSHHGSRSALNLTQQQVEQPVSSNYHELRYAKSGREEINFNGNSPNLPQHDYINYSDPAVLLARKNIELDAGSESIGYSSLNQRHQPDYVDENDLDYPPLSSMGTLSRADKFGVNALSNLNFEEDDDQGGGVVLNRQFTSNFSRSPRGFDYDSGFSGVNEPLSREEVNVALNEEIDRQTANARFTELYSTNNVPSPQARQIVDTVTTRTTTTTSTMNAMDGTDGWRNPDLRDIIEYLTTTNVSHSVRASAAAYLVHLTFQDDSAKSRTRTMGGLLPLVQMLQSPHVEEHRNALSALRNLSFGVQNDENKREICRLGGLAGLVQLLKQSRDNEILELVTAVLWNLSSAQEVKQYVIHDTLIALTQLVLLPHAGLERRADGSYVNVNREIYWSTVFRNASGVLRNVSADGESARARLRECDGLVDALLHIVRSAINNNDIDNKSVENCVCTLRNLTFACQEVVDPSYLRRRQTSAMATKEEQGKANCFGKQRQNTTSKSTATTSLIAARPVKGVARGMDLLWQPDIVNVYLPLVSDCSNPDTLEAAAGALQNLAACEWQPSIEIRANVRKEKGLPLIVELLNIDSDKVVCAAATALRNLAQDQRNKELIGKYAMEQLINRLPRGDGAKIGSNGHGPVAVTDDYNAGGTSSNETIAAVLATIYAVIQDNADFAMTFTDLRGVSRVIYLSRSKQFSNKVVRFANSIMHKLWTTFKNLQPRLRQEGWKEADFKVRSTKGDRKSETDIAMTRPGMTQSSPSARQGSITKDKMLVRNQLHRQQLLQEQEQSSVQVTSTLTPNQTVMSTSGSYQLQHTAATYPDGTLRSNDRSAHSTLAGQTLQSAQVRYGGSGTLDPRISNGYSIHNEEEQLHNPYDDRYSETGGYDNEAMNSYHQDLRLSGAEHYATLNYAVMPGHDNSAFVHSDFAEGIQPDHIPPRKNGYTFGSHYSLNRVADPTVTTTINNEPLYARVDKEKKYRQSELFHLQQQQQLSEQAAADSWV